MPCFSIAFARKLWCAWQAYMRSTLGAPEVDDASRKGLYGPLQTKNGMTARPPSSSSPHVADALHIATPWSDESCDRM